MKKEKSVLWAWAFSYIIILLIPAISGFINYSVNMKTVNEGLMDSYELVLENFEENIEYFINAEEELYSFAFNHEKFRYLQNFNPDTLFYSSVRNLHNDFTDYVASKGHEISCLVYLRNVNYLVSEEKANSVDNCYTTLKYFEHDMMSYEKWVELIEEKHSSEYYIGTQPLKPNEQALIFANTIKNKRYNESTILVSVPLSEIAELSKTVEENNYLILSIGDEYAAAFSNGKVVEVPIEIRQNDYEDKWIFVERPLEKGNISCSLFVADEYLQDGLAYTKNVFFLNLMLTLLFGIVGIVFFLNRNYHPLHNLLEKVTAGKVDGNEFLAIAQAYKAIESEKLSSQEVLNRQKMVLRGSWLLSLMKGRSNSAYLREQKISLLPDIKENIAIVGFMIPIAEKETVEADELLFFVVDNIFSELMEKYTFYRIEDGRFLYYLMDLHDISEAEWLRIALEKVEYLYSIVLDNMKVSMNCVVSGIDNKLDNIHYLYQKVVDTFEFQNTIDSSGVISTLELEGQEKISRVQEQVRSELMNALRTENLQKAQEMIDYLLQESSYLSFSSVKMYVYDLFNKVIAVFQEYDTDPAHGVKILQYVEVLTQAKDADAIRNVFYCTLEYVAERIGQQLHRNSGGITEQIKEYVKEHYAEQDLNISSIAEYLQRTPKHISKVFKDETGEGILDYINHFRVMQARELMQEEKYRMEEIAVLVGYLDGRDFRRAFTKVMGVTPSKYMK